jgi:dTDP-4-amino-4,6-dideoxygalactose transaminase
MTNPLPANVPLLDVSRGNGPLEQEIQEAIARVLRSGKFLHGPEVGELEAAIASLCGARHAIACASGSDALLLALMSLEIGPGDEVIVPSFTFFATASAVTRLSARPVFVDIEPDSFNLNVDAVEAAITSSTRAIIPVHLFGQCAQMDRLLAIARKHDLFLVEDAAQAIGARFESAVAGGMGDIGCFSFYPTKNLGAFGDAGMLTTSSASLENRLRLLAAHGMQPRYFHRLVGINSRLDSIQAAVLNVKLKQLEAWTNGRERNASRYVELFAKHGLDAISLPPALPGRRHVWNQFTVRIPDGRRDAVKAQLAAAGVGSEIYYPVPLHLQQCFANYGYKPGSLPETERACREVLSLPIFPELTEPEQEAVVSRLAAICRAEGLWPNPKSVAWTSGLRKSA